MKTSLQKKNISSKGFSLVEFIVILTLFAIMASVVTFDYQNYRRKVERSNFATDVALAIRQMQVYGISSSNRTVGGAGFDEDDNAVQAIIDQNLVLEVAVYGAEIDIDEQIITLYQDVLGGSDTEYDEGIDVVVDILQVSGDNQISHVCTTSTSSYALINEGTGECQNSIGNPSQSISSGKFTVSFKRPFPDARFSIVGLQAIDSEITTAVIVVGTEGLTGRELRYIHLDPVGLIQVSEPEFTN